MYNGSDSNTSVHTRFVKPLETRRTSHYPEMYSIIHYLSPTWSAKSHMVRHINDRKATQCPGACTARVKYSRRNALQHTAMERILTSFEADIVVSVFMRDLERILARAGPSEIEWAGTRKPQILLFKRRHLHSIHE